MSERHHRDEDIDISRFLKDFEKSVRAQGLRMTSQRQTIAETFFKSKAHVTVDDLYAMVRKEDDRIGHATVYRTLRFMEESGLAESHRFGGGKLRYEVQQHHHDHIICVKCGTIKEFENQTMEDLQEEIAQEHGFVLKSHRMEIYGICPACLRKTGTV